MLFPSNLCLFAHPAQPQLCGAAQGGIDGKKLDSIQVGKDPCQ